MIRAKRFLELNINYFVRRRIPTIVYSMERSGSVALFHSLSAHGVFALATHQLDFEKIQTGRHSGSALWACKHIVRKRRRAKIISLVRNPIDNMISAFARFEFLPVGKNHANGENNLKSTTVEEITNRFRTCYLEQGKYLHQLNWFDSEFKKALGIDVYHYPFDKEQGYVQFQEGPYDILILRTELDAEKKSLVVSSFLDLENFKISNAVSGSKIAPGIPGEQSSYGEIYKNFKRRVAVPKEFFDEIVRSQYVQHFFTPESLDTTRKRFQR